MKRLDEINEGMFSKKKPKDVAKDLKSKFEIMYQTGLESGGDYKDFEKHWKEMFDDIVEAIEKSLK